MLRNGKTKEMSRGSGKLNWFLPDAFGYIRGLRTMPPAGPYEFINLSIGAPNRPTPPAICEVMKTALGNPAYHTYPPQFGAPELCEAVAEWYKKRFGVVVDPKREVLITIGMKEAIFNSLHALLNPGDVILVPDPGYPTYFEAASFCGAKIIPYDSNLDEKGTLAAMRSAAAEYSPTYAIVNYPSNPTGRVVSRGFYAELQACAKEKGFTVLSDLAYSEIAFDGFKVPSYFEASGSPAGGLEYFAFSKTYNMAGWRVGAIVADETILEPIKLYKSKIDSNVFYPIQIAAASALRDTPADFYAELSGIYQQRRDALFKGLDAAGLSGVRPMGAMYAWVHVPQGFDSWEFTKLLYNEYGVLGVPGIAYGANGKDYVRLGLVQEVETMAEVANRLMKGDIRHAK
jgi:LL-diaminopimelate aminotransferase